MPAPRSPITISLVQRGLLQAASSLRKGGWGNTGMDWRNDLGPINPLADQPAQLPRWSPPADNTTQYNLRAIMRMIRRSRGQGPDRSGLYRKRVGGSVQFTMPDYSDFST